MTISRGVIKSFYFVFFWSKMEANVTYWEVTLRKGSLFNEQQEKQ